MGMKGKPPSVSRFERGRGECWCGVVVSSCGFKLENFYERKSKHTNSPRHVE
jgi:hypothetical protein